MQCSKCGSKLKEGVKFCTTCGEAVVAIEPPREPLETGGDQGLTQDHVPSEEQVAVMGTASDTARHHDYQSQAPSPPQPPGLGPETSDSTSYQQAQAASPARRAWLKPLIICLSILIVAGLAVGGVFIYLKVTEPSRTLSQARSLCEEGDYIGSMEVCDKILEKWPNSTQAEEARSLKPEAYILYGEGLIEEGSIDCCSQAEAVFNDLLNESYSDTERLNADRFELYTTWARVCNSEGILNETVVNYDNAAAIQELSVEDLNIQSECLYNLGEQKKGEGGYSEAAGFYGRCYFENSQGPLAGSAKTNWVDMSVSSQTNQAPPSKDPTNSGVADVVIINNTDEGLRYFFSGPSSEYFDVPAQQRLTVNILPGYYSEVVYFSSDNSWLWPTTGVDYLMNNAQGNYSHTIYYD